jgi:transcriptional regulator with XRE-family HTH domain
MSKSRKRKIEPQSLAASLRAWRKSKGWTRKQAAEFLGVNVRTLESWEYGYRAPPMTAAFNKLWGTRRVDP